MTYIEELATKNPGMPAQNGLIEACREVDRLRAFIAEARKQSELLDTTSGPKIIVPYWFMRDEIPRQT